MTNLILHNKEPLIGLSEAGHKYRVHPNTLARWIIIGCRGKVSGRLQLEAVRVGAKWQTSEAALERFFAGLTAASVEAAPDERKPTGDERRAAQITARELELAGA